ncbi:MAG: winged helix-turn-helix transcriptional regulator [Lachnospiraceae bacterium]|jgi:DNA-binding transcriptional ArsR family regulator|nr:winged helix-turn-helix transcriptional regulator [Lachnospiraceae bacterium]MCI8997335.1 winged helix-turn-helix transcriptional regulator [Lachnospiraceae bacterium]MCI9134470.1 winged helix-turn-helix transcriptional regulator [Lachnospiraceae bacterium]
MEQHTLAEEEVYFLADLFKVFGDPTRIKILYLLLEGELCVNDIAASLGMSQSSISHQLKTLKQHRLVKFRRNGKTIFYALDDEHVVNILNQGLEHIEH